jgi:hypothetical protein
MAYGNYAPFYRGGYFNPMQTPTMPMAENQNQFAQPYQPQVQPTAPMPNTVTPTQPNNDFIWVQGEAGAKAYLVAPNTTVTLWDSENQTIYLKTADMNGVPSMRVLDFTERVANAPKTATEHTCQCGDKFATKEQLNVLQGKYDDIMAIVEDLQTKSNTKSTKSTKKTEDE